METPDDALGCFLSSSLDVLYLGDRRIEKLRMSEAVGSNGATPDALVPALDDSILVAAVVRSKDGAALPARYHCRTRGGQRAPIDEEEFRLLTLVDGNRTIAEIAGLLSTESAGSVAEKVIGGAATWLRGASGWRRQPVAVWQGTPVRRMRESG